MRPFVASITLVLATVAIATADEFMGVVTKFEDGKITFTDFKGLLGGGEKPEPMTLPVTGNVKVLKAKATFDGGLNIETEGDYEGGKDAFAKAVKDAMDKKKADAKKADAKKADDKKADDKKADDKKAGDKKGFGKGLGKKGGGLFGGGIFAQIITEGEGDNAKVTEIRVININLKKGPN